VSLVIRNAGLARGERVDVHCAGGKIARVEPSPAAPQPARAAAAPSGVAAELDATGRLLVPALVIPDLHLDKAFFLAELLGRVEPEAARPGADWTRVWRPGGRHPLGRSGFERAHGLPLSVVEAVAAGYTVEDVASRAERVVRMALAHGVCAIRAFADVAPGVGLTAVQGLLRVRERYRGEMRMQIGAFPQWGLTDRQTVELMDEALRQGADVVGGIPWAEATPAAAAGHIATCFDLAERHDAPVHMLIDDTADPSSRTLELLARHTEERGFHGRVCASNCVALAFYDRAYAARIIESVARACITVVSNAHVNLIDAGALFPAPAPRTITLLRELRQGGVNVALGQDDVDDFYYPWGQADPLEVAFLTSHAVPLYLPAEIAWLLETVTTNAARAMGLAEDVYPYRITPGAPADLALIGAPTWHQALQLRPAGRVLIVSGRVVVETETATRFARHSRT
jgi:cytosine/creatinine deaminase